MTGLLRISVLLATVVCLGCGAPALAADGANNTILLAQPLDAGGAPTSATIEVLGDADWYSFDTAPGVTMDGVEIQKTNKACGVQGSLFGTSGDRIGGVLVGDERTEALRLISPVAQRYFVMIDDATLFFCTGADYTLRLLPSEPVEPAQVGTAAAHARNPLGCVTDTGVIDQLTYRVRQDIARLHLATTASKRKSWRSRLKHDKRTLKSWRAQANRDCGP
jgi:hypothetical protein